MARPHHEEILEAFRTKRTVDTRSIDYGFFTSAQGAAYAMAAGAINSASWLYRTAVGGGGTAPLPGGKNMPAVYAQAYDQGRSFSLVVTNKGENAEALSVAVDDRPVNARLKY